MSQLSISSLLSASGSEYVSQYSLNNLPKRSYASERRNNEEHVYENIIRFRKNESKKFASLNRLIVKLRLKTKIFPRMLSVKKSSYQQPIEGSFDHDFDDNSQDFDDGSYTSCLEENIYEDLDFYSCSSMTTTCEDSLNAWFQLISTSPEDYDECDFMIHKGIPSRREKLNCQQTSRLQFEESSSLSLFELQKLEIIKKCLISIWYQPTESGIMKSLFLILKEMFNEYLQRENAANTTSRALLHYQTETNRATTEPLEMDANTNRKTKLEHFILSITLNKRLITYDKNLKFIFTIKNSPWWNEHCDISRSSNQSAIEWKHSEKSAENPIDNSTSEIGDDVNLISTNITKIEDDSHDSKENIYQQLWQCTNNSQTDDICEYADWEVDSEFSFAKSYNLSKMPFSEVIVYYKNECENNEEVKSAKLNPVENWKNMLRSTNYVEDEEDMVTNENFVTRASVN